VNGLLGVDDETGGRETQGSCGTCDQCQHKPGACGSRHGCSFTRNGGNLKAVSRRGRAR
jgi:hypothetical protein